MTTITKSDLIYSLKELVLSLKKEWRTLSKKQSAITREELVGFRDGVLVPVLEKITLLGGNAIRLEKNSDFEEAVKLLADIYQSAGEVQRFAIRDEEHLSWTLPSKLALEYLYILGALTVKHKNLDALQALLDYKIEYPYQTPYENYAGRSVLLLKHPFYNHQSNEGNLLKFFDDAKKVISDSKIFFEWFDDDTEQVLTTLVEFDFVRGFYLAITVEDGWTYHNFRRFYTFRVMPMIRRLVTNSHYKKIFGNDIKQNLIKFLVAVDDKRNEFSDGWGVGDWKNMPELKD